MKFLTKIINLTCVKLTITNLTSVVTSWVIIWNYMHYIQSDGKLTRQYCVNDMELKDLVARLTVWIFYSILKRRRPPSAAYYRICPLTLTLASHRLSHSFVRAVAVIYRDCHWWDSCSPDTTCLMCMQYNTQKESRRNGAVRGTEARSPMETNIYSGGCALFPSLISRPRLYFTARNGFYTRYTDWSNTVYAWISYMGSDACNRNTILRK